MTRATAENFQAVMKTITIFTIKGWVSLEI